MSVLAINFGGVSSAKLNQRRISRLDVVMKTIFQIFQRKLSCKVQTFGENFLANFRLVPSKSRACAI